MEYSIRHVGQWMQKAAFRLHALFPHENGRKPQDIVPSGFE